MYMAMGWVAIFGGVASWLNGDQDGVTHSLIFAVFCAWAGHREQRNDKTGS